jgi:CBS domain-containing protein
LTWINETRCDSVANLSAFRALSNSEIIMKVKDVMHKGATSVVPTASLQDIAKRMRDNDIGVVPVTENGHLVGILTDRDIVCRAVADTSNLGKLTARDVMTRDVVCCSPDDDIAIAIDVMETKLVRRLPVTDSHKSMVGMLSLGDISHKVGKELSGEVLRALSGHHL